MVAKNKKSQSEVITTVLLILVGIAAVAVVSTFVINMVRNNLQGTECFDAVGQLEINVDGGYTFYNYSSKLLYVNVVRAEKDFNLTGLVFIVGSDIEKKPITIHDGINSGVYPAANLPNPLAPTAVSLPVASQTYTYVLDMNTLYSTLMGNITRVSIAPIIIKQCKEEASKTIPVYV